MAELERGAAAADARLGARDARPAAAEEPRAMEPAGALRAHARRRRPHAVRADRRAGARPRRGRGRALDAARREDATARRRDAELRDHLVTLLVAGHETTATTLAWTFERLLRHPAALARAREEALDGGHEYLDAVVQESQRVRPVIGYAMRSLTAPMEVGGYTVPAGATARHLDQPRPPPPRPLPRPARVPARALRAAASRRPTGGSRSAAACGAASAPRSPPSRCARCSAWSSAAASGAGRPAPGAAQAQGDHVHPRARGDGHDRVPLAAARARGRGGGRRVSCAPRPVPSAARTGSIEIARTLERTGWAFELVDADWRVVWFSEQLAGARGRRRRGRSGWAPRARDAQLPAWDGMLTSRARTAGQRPRAVPARHDPRRAPGRHARRRGAPAPPGAEPVERRLRSSRRRARRRASAASASRCARTAGTLGYALIYGPALAGEPAALVVRGDERLFSRMARLVEPRRTRGGDPVRRPRGLDRARAAAAEPRVLRASSAR